MGKQHLEGQTRAARRHRRRQAGTLRDLTVQPRTLKRCTAAVTEFYDWLEQERAALPSSADAADVTMAFPAGLPVLEKRLPRSQALGPHGLGRALRGGPKVHSVIHGQGAQRPDLC